MPDLLFLRDYQAFAGGHLKLADYIGHTAVSGLFRPRLFMVPGSRADHPFPRDCVVGEWRPETADALFLAGLDWEHLPAGVEDRVPVINLIQGLGHAQPDNPRYAFLSRRATRIGVSPEITQALAATGRVNGPLHTIPAGLDLMPIPKGVAKVVPVFIAGLKNPALAQAIAAGLATQGIAAQVQTAPLPRADYLCAMARAEIIITLPEMLEGFYLPALEAMAAGCLVVCPDAGGNRAFCRDGETCLMPGRDVADFVAAVLRLRGDGGLAAAILAGAAQVAQGFTLETERAAYHRILAQITPATV
jgi:glycosyltransferase involved in cell wall biosynthesis